MYKTLASWRGLLVVVIVLYHTPILALTEAAHMAVSLFFVMSGAMLAMRHPTVDCSLREWLWPRAKRIYAVHWLVFVMLAAVLLPMGALKVDWSLVANALLVQTWIPVRDVYLSVNKPTWFLSALLVCYACYPLLSRLFSRMKLQHKWMLAIGVMALHCVVMGVVSQDVRDWLFVMPLIRLGEFIWGMVLGASLPALEEKIGSCVRKRASLFELGVIAVAVAVIIAVGRMSWLDCCEDIAVWWIPASLIIAMCVVLNGSEGIVGRLMLTRPMTWLGSINLEVYMLSSLVTFFYSRYIATIAGHFGHPEFYGYNWPITLPLTLLAATLLHPLFKRLK